MAEGPPDAGRMGIIPLWCRDDIAWGKLMLNAGQVMGGSDLINPANLDGGGVERIAGRASYPRDPETSSGSWGRWEVVG